MGTCRSMTKYTLSYRSTYKMMPSLELTSLHFLHPDFVSDLSASNSILPSICIWLLFSFEVIFNKTI